jgi:hypothetical protein
MVPISLTILETLSAKTVRNVHVLIHRALKDAVRWGYTVRNVADAVDPPKAKPAELSTAAGKWCDS